MAAKHVLQLKQEAEEADPQKTLDANSHLEDFPSRSFHALSSRDSRNCTVKGGNNYHHIDLLHHNDQNQVALPPGSRVTDFVRRGQGSYKHKYAGLNQRERSRCGCGCRLVQVAVGSFCLPFVEDGIWRER